MSNTQPTLSDALTAAAPKEIASALSEANTQLEAPAIKMKIPEALEFADEWAKGCTFHEGSQGWRVVCSLLAGEVRRLQTENEARKARERVLVGALEATLAWYEAEDDHSKCPNFYKRIEMCRTSETLVREALASVKGGA